MIISNDGPARVTTRAKYHKVLSLTLIATLVFCQPLVAQSLNLQTTLKRMADLLAPNSKYWAWVTPAQRGTGKKAKAAQQQPDPTPAGLGHVGGRAMPGAIAEKTLR